MITIQSGMFLALGFLVATLVWLLAAPGLWARAVRLTTQRLRETMPMSEAEIRADKDRLRAEFALKIHRQQMDLDETKLAAARQAIELNRRDARINGLESEVESLKSALEGAINARSVLEQTVAERLPRVETRLDEAKEHLSQRDKVIADLTRSAERQQRALQEANAINEQLKREVRTLTTALEAAGAKERAGAADSRTDAFVALRAELDALRTRSREQSTLIDRLQKALAESAAPEGLAVAKAAGLNGKAASLRGNKAAKATDDGDNPLRVARELAAKQELEIARLKAAVAANEKVRKGNSAPESRAALEGTLSALEEKATQQEATIAKLRAELAALQEQLTRQTAEHTAEIERLGSGTLPAAAPDPTPAPSGERTRRAIPRLTLAERMAQSRREADEEEIAASSPPEVTANGTNSDAPTIETAVASAPEKATAATPEPRAASRIKSRLLDRISDLSKA